MMENIPEAKQVEKLLRTTVCKICKYVLNEMKQRNERFDFPPDSENTFCT